MANLTHEEINRIRTSVNIVDIIGSNINLQKKGKNYFGICPFHDDHTPSMSVSEEKQIYTCFVCGATGNVFSFLRDYENISFMEAVGKIADLGGIKLEKNITITKKYDIENKMFDLAVKYYKNNLKSKDGIEAKQYLLSRKISEDIINEFDIGVSFNNNELSKFLLNKKYEEKALINLGLCGKKDNLYDIFRNRIMFPIHNSNGDAVGFSARIYRGESDSKYINSRETYLFKKGEILFNYHRAIIEAKKQKKIIVCEGQMDAIRIYSVGIKNVIATMGTALTKYHINLIKKMNAKVLLNMDSDNAGINAAITNGELLRNAGVEVNIINLSGAKDPDEYIIKYGVDAYKNAMNHSINYFDFKLSYLKSNKNLNNPDELSEYINKIIMELNKTDDTILKNVTINKISEEYNIDKKLLEEKISFNEPKSIIIKPKIKLKKQSKSIRAIEEILYYMMNNVKYANIFTKKLNYIPEKKYFDIEKDIQAYIIVNKTINLADFISYETNTEKENLIKEIIKNHNNNIDMTDEEFMNYINITTKWVKENKINNLKMELAKEKDLNRKKELMDMITKIKRGSVEYGK